MSRRSGSEFDGEKGLQRDCLARLRDSGSIQVGQEVPLLGRTVDLVYIDDGDVITIEFKMHDWRRAIRQARDHRLGADYAYVCMPRRRITERLRDELARAGVGLVFYREGDSWPFETAIAAPRSEETWPVARSLVLEYIRAREGM